MKTLRFQTKRQGRNWALACSLFAALAIVPQFTFANESGSRVAIRPGAANQNQIGPQRNRPTFPTHSSPPQLRETFPSNDAPLLDDSPGNGPAVSPAPSHRGPSIDEELTYRYTDPRMVRFLQSTSIDRKSVV